MSIRISLVLLSICAATPVAANDEAPAQETKTLSGMSILGNDEAPTALVIVPWKSSQIGSSTGLSNLLDAGIEPVDKDVFMRELGYYAIRAADPVGE
jgi:hypothetical protein